MNELDIGRQIVARRKRLKISQEQLARLANVSRSTLSALETGSGTRGATIATLTSVLTVLGLAVGIVEAERP
ncbi:MAG: helix-turn-helix domain-containing protein [Pseudolysinimonas sp.]